MSELHAVHDRLFDRFNTSIEHAYNANELLAAFWPYAYQLLLAEFDANAAADRKSVAALGSVDAESFARRNFLADEITEVREIADGCELAQRRRSAPRRR